MNRVLSKYVFYLPVTLLKGERVLKHLRQKKINQFLPQALIRERQERQLRKLLVVAHRESEFYKSYPIEEMPEQGNSASFWEWFSELPYVSKQDLIEHGDKIRATRSLFSSSKTTGGSTGEPVKLIKNSDALAHERAATWRAYEWAGISIGDKQTRFWGIPLSSEDQWKAKIIDYVANRQRISAFALDDGSLRRYYKQFIDFRPAYLYGYASVIRIFAQFVHENNLAVPASLRSVVTTSEVLTNGARRDIESAFKVKVFNEYGCGEVGSIAHECQHGTMHIMSDNVVLELDSPGNSRTGEIVVTDLHNTDMPLIRYRLGDFASSTSTECQCGVTFPGLASIHGRAYDMIVTQDDRQLHPESLMYIFEKLQSDSNGFRHFQAIQTSIGSFDVNVVPSEHWSDTTAEKLQELMRKHIHEDLDITIRIVEKIERERSGKLRVIKSMLQS